MEIKEGEKYLVTSDNWFVGPDGNQYKSAWGKVYLKSTFATLGFEPKRPSTNWFLIIGEDNNSVIMAGCQIHFLVKCDTAPNRIPGTYLAEGKYMTYNDIWNTEVKNESI